MSRLPALWSRPLDLPLERDGSGRFLPWIVALMVYLAALALAGLTALHGAVARWDTALSGTLTVQLPPGDGAAPASALAAIRAAPGILRAELLEDAAAAKLLEPWLGAGVDMKELRLPRLVDLHIDPARPFDEAGFRARLAAAAPGARLDDHRSWLDPLVGAAVAVEMIAGAIVLLVGGAAVLSIVFATRTGLAIHQGAIEVLHLIGAHDAYIARQFQWQALRLALRGGFMGLVAAALTLIALWQASSEGAALRGAAPALPAFSLTPTGWAVPLLLLPCAGVIALVTARLTVLRALARMP
ncbi:MAG: hypothetical protein JO010_08655 [Alphaproteobacteria bacterium]|nr:hypothetical protein [Alphaproteobacteria bacterium]